MSRPEHDPRATPGSKQAQLIEGYEALLEKFSLILDSAHEGEWSTVIEEESSYLAEAERLGYLEADMELDPELELHKQSLARKILQHSVEIQGHLRARQDILGRLIKEAENRRKLHHSYAASNELDPPEAEESFGKDSQ